MALREREDRPSGSDGAAGAPGTQPLMGAVGEEEAGQWKQGDGRGHVPPGVTDHPLGEDTGEEKQEHGSVDDRAKKLVDAPQGGPVVFGLCLKRLWRGGTTRGAGMLPVMCHTDPQDTEGE